jgi:hypothetical protein
MGKSTIRCWSSLSNEQERDNLKNGCHNLEVTVMEVFRRAGWNYWRRIKG